MDTQADLLSKRSQKGPEAERDEAEKKLAIFEQSPFASLPAESRDALLAHGTVERLSRRHRLAQQGEAAKSLVLIGSGRVRLERSNGQRVFPLGHRGPGEIVGESALTVTAVSGESAVVLDETEALVLSMSGVRKLVASDEALRAASVSALADRCAVTERRLESLLLNGVEARLVDFLRGALSRWGETCDVGHRITAPFTHADIALLVGSTRETVTLLLGKLKREGLIDLEKRRILVPNRGALDRYTGA